jgi:subtilisin family serine protease
MLNAGKCATQKIQLSPAFLVLIFSAIVGCTAQAAAQEARYIVRFKSNLQRASLAETNRILNAVVREMPSAGLQDIDRLPHDNSVVMRMGLSAAMAISARSDVESIELDGEVRAFFDPNDAYYSTQYALNGEFGIQANLAWDRSSGDRKAVLAIIDTGADLGHPDLKANLWSNSKEVKGNRRDDDRNGCVDDIYGCDFVNRDGVPQDDHGHGTHVAGIVAAVANNGEGVAGVAWSSRIVVIKGLDSSGAGYISTIIKGIDYATDLKKSGASIVAVNLSLGGDKYSDALYRAVERARNHDILIVTAAGNEGRNNDVFPLYPANLQLANILSVAATTSSGELANFSNFGSSIHIAAPGSGVVSTALQRNGSVYRSLSGTSMASPHVAGVIALVSAANPGLSLSQARAIVLASARPLPSLSGVVVTGAMLQALSAVDLAFATAPQPRVFGYILDRAKGVSGATVTAQSRTAPTQILTTTSAKDGSYAFDQVRLDTYSISVKARGKRFPVTSLRVSKAGTTRKSISAR